ncbi:hypothetical protein ACH5RR_008146 [Cinchona calisaya]|uniref:RING-type E3 ubiquitin transferase n=1 Tax=Cinchona calisaya TaxID=153742 RepID=A0ABD3AAS3_9GENT
MKGFLAFGGIFSGLLVLFCFGYAKSYLVDGEFGGRLRSRNSMTYKYERMDEVKKECSFVLSSASNLRPADDIVYSLREELSFLNGDWWQESNGEDPIMPFDNDTLNLGTPSKLVSFWVTDVSRARRSKKWIGVSGALLMGITSDSLFMEKPYEGSPHFDIWPGHSQLSVSFQGVYAESEKNGGERVMCLLGQTMLPSRQPESGDPWQWVKESGYVNQPPLVQDDRILLVLRYPRTFTLVRRSIRGSMKSLNLKSNLKFFSKISMSSWLAASANYEFGSEKIVSRACDPYPYKDSLMNGDFDVYKGLDFCNILDKFTKQEALTIVPNWKCNGTDDFCSKLGPFRTDKEIKVTDGSFKDVKLVIQDFRCQEMTVQGDPGFRRISSVFRAVPPSEKKFIAAERTGLNNMTLSAEGIWKSSSGQLCMVGCLGLLDSEHTGCHSRVCLYIPLSFSIKQRSIIMGTFSSIDGGTRPYFPLSFDKLVRPAELWDQFTAARPFYKYSKIDAAGAVLEKSEPFNFGNIVKKSLLKFPKLEGTETFLVSLSLLSEDLTLHIPAVPDSFSSSFLSRTDFQMEIVSLGPLFGRYWSPNVSTTEQENPYHDKAEYTEKQLLLNVSAQIGLTGKSYDNFSVLFVEGLYNQHVGKMYLIGCRDVRASWNILHESMDLEAGLDCQIEVMVSYPPTTASWLVNPTASISISSRRNEDDPLYFRPVKLQTFPVVYRGQREDILSRRGVEGSLRILTLSFAIACLLSQIFCIRDNADSVPYISLVMLGTQALGYSLPLITGAEAIFEKMSSESYENPSYDLEKSQVIRVIDYTVKLLVLVAFSLTLRLCQKVWRSRIRLLTRTPLEPHRVPNEKWVLLTTLTIHVIGYAIVLFVHSLSTSHRPLQTERFIDSSGKSQTLREWETELEEYSGLIQDLFLLPQIIGNYVWQLHCKPLTKFYYIGITAVRLLPHVYDFVRSPIPNPYFSEEYEFVNPRFNFFSKFGDIAIPVTAAVLAVIAYVQQRWNYDKLSQILMRGQSKLLPLGSKVYERLSSVSAEAELSSGVNANAGNQKDDDGE